MSLESPTEYKKLDYTIEELNEELDPQSLTLFMKEEGQLTEPSTSDSVSGFNKTKSILFALLVAVLFAFHTFFLGNLANLGYLARLISGIGMAVCALFHYAVAWVIAYQNGNPYWTWKNSIIIDRYTSRISWWVVLAIVVNSINTTIGGFGVIYSFKFALESNINLGIVTSVFGLTPFITAMFFYFLFSEKLQKAHLVGMIFMMSWIILIGFGVHSTQEDLAAYNSAFANTYQGLSKAFWAFFLAILCPISFAINGVVVRVMNTKFSVKPSEFTNAYFLTQSILMIIGWIFAYAYDNYKFNLREFIQVLMAGILAGLGSIFLSRAVTIGCAGVVYSLINGQVIFFTILNAVFYFQVPSSVEIIAAGLCIIGSWIMSMGPEISNKLKQLFNQNDNE